MAKLTHIKLEGAGCYDVSKLTSQTQAELVIDLAKAGNDVEAVMIKYRGKVTKVR